MNRRVVITGMGALSPIGNSVEEMWQSAKAGKCGIDKITAYDTTNLKAKLAGELKNFNCDDIIDKKEQRRMDSYAIYAMAAADEAYKQSGLNKEEIDTNRCGVMISSGIGGLTTIQHEHEKAMEKGYDRVSPFFIPMVISNMAAGLVAIRYGFNGICNSVVTACAGGTNAIGDAFRSIRDGYHEVMLCGGAESCIVPLGMGGFTAMKALCENEEVEEGSVPFDARRSGFVMGEGAGILVLEEYEHAKARGANILGEVVGYGVNCDAYHMTAPTPDGSGAAKCMKMAIEDAGITADKIGYINAHGTSTPINDRCETMAIKLALGEHASNVLVSSTKSMTGHLLGAAGAIEAIISAKALSDSFVPPTINYKEADPECDLDIVPNVGRSADITYAMSNSLGFGGHNATILLKKVSE